MCVLTLAWNSHPDWLLLAAGNRDEAHARASAALARWNDGSGVIEGRDLQSGGMWLGVSEAHARFAVITNVTGEGPPDPEKLSRGGLVHDALTRRDAFAPVAPDRYNPFNLLVVAEGEVRVRSNRPQGIDRPLPSGWHGLSNGRLDDPWDRTDRLTLAAQAWMNRESSHPEGLLARLDDRTDADPLAPQGPIFRSNAVYGTRCSTVVAVDREGMGRIWERRFDSEGAITGETEIAFPWMI